MVPLLALFAAVFFQTPEEVQKRAEELYARGDLEEAEKLLEDLVASRPALAPARFQLAAVYLRLGRLGEAEKLFTSVLAELPGNPELCYRIGLAYFLEKRAEEARRYFERALEIEPTHAEALLALGQLEGRDGNLERALALLEKAASRPVSHYYRAAVLERMGRDEEMIEAARRAVDLAPNDAAFRRFLGGAYLKVEDWPRAEAE
ncbi:MAG: tetratricopeptide repeat protein, partial [Vicinamibacteria bacterium]